MWKKKDKTRKKFHVLGLLKLMGAFRLRSELSCEALAGLKIVRDVIHTLLSKRVQLRALELVLIFDLTEKFPPVRLLNSYIKDSKKRAKEVYEDAKMLGGLRAWPYP